MAESWITLASQASVIKRSLTYAAVVGPVLVAINHGDALLSMNVDATVMVKIALTFCVPYLVATFSSVGALRTRQGRDYSQSR